MANTIKIKNSGTASNVPSSLEYGELGLNYADGKLYYKNSSNTIVQFSAPSTGASSYVVQGRLTGDATVTPNSDLVIPFVDDFDPNNWWDATSKRFTPTIAGYYNITLQVWWTIAAVTNNQNNIQVRKNGNTFAISQTQTFSGNGYSQNATKLVYLNGSTDYVDFTAYTGNSSAQSLQWGGNSNGQGTYFSASLVTVGKGDKGDTGATGATGPAGASGATILDDLTDVTINTAASGQILSYNGSQWTNIENFAEATKHYVKNDSGVTLDIGTPVYTSGANGTNILVKKAQANAETTSATILGIMSQSTVSNGTGLVVTQGLVSGFDTSTATAGDPVWLSPSTAGGLAFGTANKPSAPNHLVYIGTVTRVQSQNGEIFVNLSNGWEIEELHNVSISTPASGQILEYNGSLWVNKNTVRDNMIRFYMEVLQ